ncbi:MAG: hypothetical protein V3S48_05030, partial [Candidatus Neomarinimicrobiota bacterium]
ILKSQIPIVSTDPNYNLFELGNRNQIQKVSGKAGIIIQPRKNLVTYEAGGKARLRIKLASKPKGKVTLGLTSSNKSEGILSTNILVFDSTNWDKNQVFMIRGRDDSKKDGNQNYSINILSVSSQDSSYDGLEIRPLSLINVDDERALIIFEPSPKLITREKDGKTNLRLISGFLVLASKPGAGVKVKIQSSNPEEGIVSPGIVEFNRQNWNIPQEIIISGVDDQRDDGDQDYQIQFSPSLSDDPKFRNIKLNPVNLLNIDDDIAGIIVESTSNGRGNNSRSQNYNVVLSSQPLAQVKILRDYLINSEMSKWPPFGSLEKSGKSKKLKNWVRGFRIITVTGLVLAGIKMFNDQTLKKDEQMGLPPNFPDLP